MTEEQNPNIESGKDLLSYKGFLEFYTETGTEGAYWAFQDERFINEKNSSYEGLRILRNGDELTIYDKEEPERVIWKGVISLTSFTCFKESVFNLWIHNDQVGTEREMWAKWFIDGNPAELTTKVEAPNQK
ncbi:MAG TPA: hypothetical protein VMR19_00675 [Candidatus Saccharimonadales bacterium]|jgi:hypothetical protein|nr:hypothetical protein [Candidatus Saccharimonadales bacterium]